MEVLQRITDSPGRYAGCCCLKPLRPLVIRDLPSEGPRAGADDYLNQAVPLSPKLVGPWWHGAVRRRSSQGRACPARCSSQDGVRAGHRAGTPRSSPTGLMPKPGAEEFAVPCARFLALARDPAVRGSSSACRYRLENRPGW